MKLFKLNKRAATEDLLWYIVNILLAVLFVVIPLVSVISQIMHSDIIANTVGINSYSLAMDSLFSYDFLKSITLPANDKITIDNNEIQYSNLETYYVLPSFYSFSKTYNPKFNVVFTNNFKKKQTIKFGKDTTFCVNSNSVDLIRFFKSNFKSKNIYYDVYDCNYTIYFNYSKNNDNDVISFPITSLSQLTFVEAYNSVAKQKGLVYKIKRTDALSIIIPVNNLYQAYDLFKDTLKQLVQSDIAIVTNYTFIPGSKITLSFENIGIVDSDAIWSIKPYFYNLRGGLREGPITQKAGRTIEYQTPERASLIDVTLKVGELTKEITLEAKSNNLFIFTNNLTKLMSLHSQISNCLSNDQINYVRNIDINLSSPVLDNILLKKSDIKQLDYYKAIYLKTIVNRLIVNGYDLNDYYIFFSNFPLESQQVKMLFIDSNLDLSSQCKQINAFLQTKK